MNLHQVGRKSTLPTRAFHPAVCQPAYTAPNPRPVKVFPNTISAERREQAYEAREIVGQLHRANRFMPKNMHAANYALGNSTIGLREKAETTEILAELARQDTKRFGGGFVPQVYDNRGGPAPVRGAARAQAQFVEDLPRPSAPAFAFNPAGPSVSARAVPVAPVWSMFSNNDAATIGDRPAKRSANASTDGEGRPAVWQRTDSGGATALFTPQKGKPKTPHATPSNVPIFNLALGNPTAAPPNVPSTPTPTPAPTPAPTFGSDIIGDMFGDATDLPLPPNDVAPPSRNRKRGKGGVARTAAEDITKTARVGEPNQSGTARYYGAQKARIMSSQSNNTAKILAFNKVRDELKGKLVEEGVSKTRKANIRIALADLDFVVDQLSQHESVWKTDGRRR